MHLCLKLIGTRHYEGNRFHKPTKEMKRFKKKRENYIKVERETCFLTFTNTHTHTHTHTQTHSLSLALPRTNMVSLTIQKHCCTHAISRCHLQASCVPRTRSWPDAARHWWTRSWWRTSTRGRRYCRRTRRQRRRRCCVWWWWLVGDEVVLNKIKKIGEEKKKKE